MNDPFAIAVPPFQRFRRLRQTPALRRLVQETRLHPAEFILPLFVTHGFNVREEIGAMPGVYHLSVDRLPHAVLGPADRPALSPGRPPYRAILWHVLRGHRPVIASLRDVLRVPATLERTRCGGLCAIPGR